MMELGNTICPRPFHGGGIKNAGPPASLVGIFWQLPFHYLDLLIPKVSKTFKYHVNIDIVVEYLI
jgi:hypothetical protein